MNSTTGRVSLGGADEEDFVDTVDFGAGFVGGVLMELKPIVAANKAAVDFS